MSEFSIGIFNEVEHTSHLNNYTFMNKDTELFDIEMDKGQAESIFNFRKENIHLLPVAFLPKKNIGISRRDFNEWWSNRRIPASRVGIKELLWRFRDSGWCNEKISGLDELAEKCLGLSLSDQYWIRPSPDVAWNDVNYFTNDFSRDIGNLLISGEWRGGNLSSPDNTSDGVIPKKWEIVDNKRHLMKGSYSSIGIPQPQPFREVFASRIASLLIEPFDMQSFVTPYSLHHIGDRVYSLCPNFVITDTEYVSFNQIHNTYKKPNHISPYDFCRYFYKKYEFVFDLTFILDYIVLNEDRHFGNFGMIRCVSTGDFLHPAPIFDTGSSLFYDSNSLNVRHLKSKPFTDDFNKQIEMTNFSKYQQSLKLAASLYQDIFYEVFEDCYESKERLNSICKIIGRQIQNIICA